MKLVGFLHPPSNAVEGPWRVLADVTDERAVSLVQGQSLYGLPSVAVVTDLEAGTMRSYSRFDADWFEIGWRPNSVPPPPEPPPSIDRDGSSGVRPLAATVLLTGP